MKLADPSILKIVPAYISTMTGGYKKGIYLAPKLLTTIHEKNWHPNHDRFKSDVFTLGNNSIIIKKLNLFL